MLCVCNHGSRSNGLDAPRTPWRREGAKHVPRRQVDGDDPGFQVRGDQRERRSAEPARQCARCECQAGRRNDELAPIQVLSYERNIG
jgi:hypothetical protein